MNPNVITRGCLSQNMGALQMAEARRGISPLGTCLGGGNLDPNIGTDITAKAAYGFSPPAGRDDPETGFAARTERLRSQAR